MFNIQKYCPKALSVLFFYEAVQKPVKVKPSGAKPVISPTATIQKNAAKFNLPAVLQSKGLEFCITPISSRSGQFAENLPPKNSALIMLAQEIDEFERLNHLAKTHRRDRNTLILWHGVEEVMPETYKIPVLSLEQIKTAPEKRLDWQDLCQMANKGHKSTKAINWSNVAAL